MLAHGALLRKNFFSVDEMLAIVKDYHNAGLSPEEVTLMAFAQKIVNEPGRISQEDMDELRSFGLSDEEMLDIVVAVTARTFFSKTLDTLDIKPDEVYLELEPELVQALTIGRPFP